MSDLYLILRHRLTDMVDWVELGTETMKRARKAQGYSYEATSRLLSVSAKTYERYEKAGRVPRHLLPAVAEVLDIEIEEPARQRVTVPAEAADDPKLRATLVQILERLDRIERAVLPEAPAA